MLANWTTPQIFACCYPDSRSVIGCHLLSINVSFIPAVLLGFSSTRDSGLHTCSSVLILTWGMGAGPLGSCVTDYVALRITPKCSIILTQMSRLTLYNLSRSLFRCCGNFLLPCYEV